MAEAQRKLAFRKFSIKTNYNRMQVFTAVVNRVIVFRVVPRSSG
jgi:hypothetical protein